MCDWVYCELILWHTYNRRLREAAQNQLARQARPGQQRRFRLLAWARAWLQRQRSARGMGSRASLRGA